MEYRFFFEILVIVDGLGVHLTKSLVKLKLHQIMLSNHNKKSQFVFRVTFDEISL
jgi:hypothetical protein